MAGKRIIRKRSDLVVSLPTLAAIKPRPIRSLSFEEFAYAEILKLDRYNDDDELTILSLLGREDWYTFGHHYGIQGLFDKVCEFFKVEPTLLPLYVESLYSEYIGSLNPNDLRERVEGLFAREKLPMISIDPTSKVYNERRLFKFDWRLEIAKAMQSPEMVDYVQRGFTPDGSRMSLYFNRAFPSRLLHPRSNVDQAFNVSAWSYAIPQHMHYDPQRFEGLPLAATETNTAVFLTPGWNAEKNKPVLMLGITLPWAANCRILGASPHTFAVSTAQENYSGITAHSGINACFYAALAHVYYTKSKRTPYVNV